ncbi:unnamed protein product [Coffea canephora]|uniref:Uncharacterized protein n=1 Tax=Coffea canephora TaxID=49390 RepID=A0A068V423_COFCA|nr:unnamed protein product [Coffea canephora]
MLNVKYLLMEILTGKRSVDAEFGDGNSTAGWLRTKIKSKNGFLDILDQNAGASCDPLQHEMMLLQGIALICTSRNPADCPTMGDVSINLARGQAKEETTRRWCNWKRPRQWHRLWCSIPLAQKPAPIIEC